MNVNRDVVHKAVCFARVERTLLLLAAVYHLYVLPFDLVGERGLIQYVRVVHKSLHCLFSEHFVV